MSEFCLSPRPRIVNGVLLKECEVKNRHNGLQGTNSKEDFYRAITQMPSPRPETDIGAAESESATSDLSCNYSPRKNRTKRENTIKAAPFSKERRNISAHSSYSTHFDESQEFHTQESELQTPSPCTKPNSHIRSIPATDLGIKQERLNSEVCCEGKHLMHRNEWQSGDHCRCIADGSSAFNEGGCHSALDNCCNMSIPSNKNQLKYSHKDSSPRKVRRRPSVEDCRNSTHHCTSPRHLDTISREDNSIYRTSNSTKLHEQVLGNTHSNAENCNALTVPENTCNPQNTLHEPSSRAISDVDVIHPHKSSPEHLDKVPRECMSQNEELKCNQDAAKGHIVEYSGYPPQRGTNTKPGNTPSEDEGSSFTVTPNATKYTSQRNTKQEYRRFLRRNGLLSNVTEQEARSVAEILYHPVSEVHPVESEVLAPQCTSSLRAQSPEGVLGYPPQPPLGKSKYTVHRTHEDDSQYKEIQHCNYNIKREVAGECDYPRLNDPSVCGENGCEQMPSGQNNDLTCGDGSNESCRAYHNNRLHHQHVTENEHERACADDSTQETHCVNSEPSKDLCTGCPPRAIYTEPEENHYYNHHSTNIPEEEKNYPPKEPKWPKHYSPEDREQQFHHLHESINETSPQRKHKEPHGGKTLSYCRPLLACHEDESHRTENENVCCAPVYRHNNNPTTSSAKNSRIYPGCSNNITNEDADNDNAAYDQAGAEQEKSYIQNTNIPTGSCNYETGQIQGNPPCVCQLNSKATGGLEETSPAPSCHVNKPDDDAVPCPTELSEGSLGSDTHNERGVAEPHRRRNGIENDDFYGSNLVNVHPSFEENNETRGSRKNRMLILQDVRQNSNRQNKCEAPTKVKTVNFKTGASEERRHPSNLTSKMRIPKPKTEVSLTSHKSNAKSGGLQRSVRSTGLIQNLK